MTLVIILLVVLALMACRASFHAGQRDCLREIERRYEEIHHGRQH